MATSRRKRRAEKPPAERPGPAERRATAERPRNAAGSASSDRTPWICLALAVATIAVYARVATHEFIDMDDFHYILHNPRVVRGLTWDAVTWAFTTGHADNWHPLTWLSHMLDVELFGLRPGLHHLGGVAFHVANTLLLFGLLQRMTGKPWRSALVAGLFALHPLHVESVAWASERKDVLSTLFWMLTLWAYVGYVRRPRMGRYLAVLGLFALGLMAKPMLVTLPFVMLLLDVWPLARVSWRADDAGSASTGERQTVTSLVLEKVPLFALSAISSVVTVLVQQRGGAVAGLEAFPMGQRVANALVSYVTYLGKTFWPAGLAAIYPYPASLPTWWVIASALILIGVTVLVVLAARRHPYLPVGWFWYLGTLVPVIGLVQVGVQSMAADRYTYIPLIGLFIALTWGAADLLARWPYRHVTLPVAGGLALAACAVVTALQVPHWKDRAAVWLRAVAVTRDNYLAHNNLGNVLAESGRGREAVDHYTAALRIKPALAEAHNNLGFTLAGLGKVDEAMAHYAEALRIKPDYLEAHGNLASALAAQGRTDEAIRELRSAVRIAPDDFQSHYELAVLLRKTGNGSEAARHFEIALRLNPRFSKARQALEELRGPRGGPGPAAR